jgi:hypothetical protein
MRALFRLILPLTGLFTLCLMAFMLIGRTQPPPTLIRQLHLTDCAMPCWIGITPGATQAEAVNRYVMDTFNSTNSQLSSSVPAYEWFTIVPLTQPARRGEGMPIQFGVNQGIVGEILIPAFFGSSTPDVTMPALGDMVNLLGTPDCVGSNSLPTSGRLSLFYTFDSILLEIGLLDDDHPRWSDPIFFLSIRRNDLPNRVNDCTWAGIPLPAWAGLLDGQQYLKRFT